MSIYFFYVTPLMRYRLECPVNRYVFKSRLNCSESTAGSLRQSGSEFQTVGLATEKIRVPRVPHRTRGTNSWWRWGASLLWHCWSCLLTHENLSLMWPVMCLVGQWNLLDSVVFTVRPHCSRDSVCLSVCPSVCPSHSGIVSRRKKIRSCSFQHL